MTALAATSVTPHLPMGTLARWLWLAPLLMTSTDMALRWRRVARGPGLSPTYRRLLAGRWLVFALPCLIFGAGLASGSANLDNYFHAPSAWPSRRRTSPPSLPATLARFSPDGRQLAGADADGRLTLWRADTGEVLATPGPVGAEVADVAWGEGGAALVVADERGRVVLWELPELRAPRPLAVEGDTIATSADGTLLAVGNGEILTVLSLRANTPVMRAVTAGALVDLAFSPDGQLITTAANTRREVVPGGYQDEGVFEVWEVASGRRVAVVGGIGSGVEAIAFSPDGRTLAVGGEMYDVIFWRP